MNQATLQNVVAAAKAKASGSPAWVRCLDKASKMLADGTLCATVLNDGVLVTSPNGSYLVTAGHCPCAARTSHCYHRCAARIAILMDEAERAEEAAARCDVIIKDIKDIAADIRTTFADKYPGYRLDDTVQKLVGPYTLEMLGIAPLNYILSAIA